MSTIDFVLETLKISLPAVIVAATVHYILDKHFKHEDRKNTLKLRESKSKIVEPIRIQAYERIILFLERISPSSLVMRTHQIGESAKKLHADLLKSIREEYEHNMSQQIYISNNAWELVKKSKEETIKLINLAAGKVEDNAKGIDLSQRIFELVSSIDKTPSAIAIEYLRQEFEAKVG